MKRLTATERGLVRIEKKCSKEEARAEGYTFSFFSRHLNCELWSKSLDERGLRHTFVSINKDNDEEKQNLS